MQRATTDGTLVWNFAECNLDNPSPAEAVQEGRPDCGSSGETAHRKAGPREAGAHTTSRRMRRTDSEVKNSQKTPLVGAVVPLNAIRNQIREPARGEYPGEAQPIPDATVKSLAIHGAVEPTARSMCRRSLVPTGWEYQWCAVSSCTAIRESCGDAL